MNSESVNTFIVLLVLTIDSVRSGGGWAPPSQQKKVIVVQQPAKACVPKVIVIPKVRYVNIPGPKPAEQVIMVNGPTQKPKVIVVQQPAPPPPPAKTIVVRQPPPPAAPGKVIIVKQRVPVPVPVPAPALKPEVIVFDAPAQKPSVGKGWK